MFLAHTRTFQKASLQRCGMSHHVDIDCYPTIRRINKNRWVLTHLFSATEGSAGAINMWSLAVICNIPVVAQGSVCEPCQMRRFISSFFPQPEPLWTSLRLLHRLIRATAGAVRLPAVLKWTSTNMPLVSVRRLSCCLTLHNNMLQPPQGPPPLVFFSQSQLKVSCNINVGVVLGVTSIRNDYLQCLGDSLRTPAGEVSALMTRLQRINSKKPDKTRRNVSRDVNMQNTWFQCRECKFL